MGMAGTVLFRSPIVGLVSGLLRVGKGVHDLPGLSLFVAVTSNHCFLVIRWQNDAVALFRPLLMLIRSDDASRCINFGRMVLMVIGVEAADDACLFRCIDPSQETTRYQRYYGPQVAFEAAHRY